MQTGPNAGDGQMQTGPNAGDGQMQTGPKDQEKTKFQVELTNWLEQESEECRKLLDGQKKHFLPASIS